MNKSVNRVILVGRLGADPVLYFTPSGLTVCLFPLVTEATWETHTRQPDEVIEWHRIVAWEKLGEECCQYRARDDVVYLEGHLATRSWHVGGKHRYQITEVVADDVMFLYQDPLSPDRRDKVLEYNMWQDDLVIQPPDEPDRRAQLRLV